MGLKGNQMKRRLFAFYVRKTAILVIVTVVMIGGLEVFNHNRMVLLQQHPYYAELYAAIAIYDVQNWLADLTGGAAHAESSAGYASSVPVLVYHGIRPTAQGENISLLNFTTQLIALKRAGWQTVSMQDYYDFMRNGKKLPAKSFVITFDDGRKDSYYPVDPLLATLHFQATMFVITKSSFSPVESKFYLDKTELATMLRSGRWNLQSHAAYGHYLYAVNSAGKLGHFYSNKLWLQNTGRLETDAEFATRTLDDLKLAKSDLQQQLGVTAIAFAFPFNEVGGGSLNYPQADAIVQAFAGAQYPMDFYQVWPNKGNTQNYPEDPSFLMKRILIDSTLDSTKLLHVLSASSAKALPYASNLTTDTGDWLVTWGQTNWGPTGLTLSASRTGDGANIFLDGGGAWQNYVARANVKLVKGESMRILARYQDDTDYAACNYTNHSVTMEEVQGGITHELEEIDTQVPSQSMTVSIGVNGSTLECKVNGQTVAISNQLMPALNFGGIGFSSYDPATNNSKLQVSDVLVTPL
jgi:peptidoglycan/xylan/chitin deacetylase (PgdA/CDA1 family)